MDAVESTFLRTGRNYVTTYSCGGARNSTTTTNSWI